VSDKIKVEPS